MKILSSKSIWVLVGLGGVINVGGLLNMLSFVSCVGLIKFFEVPGIGEGCFCGSLGTEMVLVRVVGLIGKWSSSKGPELICERGWVSV